MRFSKAITTWGIRVIMGIMIINMLFFTNGVQAGEGNAEGQLPGITAFAARTELADKSNFSLWREDGGVAQKVKFGNGKVWYIAGAQNDGTELVLICDPVNPFGESQPFNADYQDNKKYNSSMGTYENYRMPDGAEVYPNHYGASDIRQYLLKQVNNVSIFTSAEKKLMKNVKIYTNDNWNNSEYYFTSDKLYLAYAGDNAYNPVKISVGRNSVENPYDGIKVGLILENASDASPFAKDGCGDFWLRSPYVSKGWERDYAEYVRKENCSMEHVSLSDNVVPVFHLDLSSVLFASAAESVSTNAKISDAMIFRYDGKEKILSTAAYDKNGINVAKGGNNEYLYIQYRYGDSEKVWSKEITENMYVYKDQLAGVDNFTDCRIWIEKKGIEKDAGGTSVDTNLIYAVMVTSVDEGNHMFSDYVSDGNATCTENGTKTASCLICGVRDTKIEEGSAFEHDYTEYVYKNLDVHTVLCRNCKETKGMPEAHDFSEDKCRKCEISKLTVEWRNFKFVPQSDLTRCFGLYGTDAALGKVNFGNGKTWYIAGSDNNGTELVLICDPDNPFSNKYFSYHYLSDKKYDGIADWGTYEVPFAKQYSTVHPNHYGASDIRKYLIGQYGEGNVTVFSHAEQEIMKNIKVYTRDTLNEEGRAVYSTSDKLYLAYGDYDGDQSIITVGRNSIENLNGGIRIGLISSNAPKSSPFSGYRNSGFWLRAPYNYDGESALYLSINGYNLEKGSVRYNLRGVPVFHMDFSSVLFASAAKTATSGAELESALTFRYDGTDVISGAVVYDNNGIKATKGGDGEYLYIQYKKGTADKVWSVEIKENMNIYKGCLGVENFADCRIWIEKKDTVSNYTYAVMAVRGKTDITEHIYGADSENEDPHKCQVCGDKGEHRFTDGKNCDICKVLICDAEGKHDFSDQPYMKNAVTDMHYQVCKYCSEISDEIGHDWGEWSNIIPSTCKTHGTDLRICRRNDCYSAETREAAFDNTNHINIVSDDAKAANCTESGLTEGKHCADCGRITEKQETVSALGHDWNVWRSIIPSTCTINGISGRTCKRTICSAAEVCKADLDSTNHENIVTDEAKTATCTENGLTGGLHCADCGKNIATPEPIPALGHSFSGGAAQTKCDHCDFVREVKREAENLTVIAGVNEATLSWSAVPGAVKYAVNMKSSAGTTLLNDTVTTNSYKATGLTGGEKVGFTVRPYIDSWGSYSPVVWAMVHTPETAVASKVVVATDMNQATISWSEVSGAREYALYQKNADGTTVLISNKITGTSYTVTNLADGARVGYCVRAKIDSAWYGYSTVTWVTLPAPAVPPTGVKAQGGDGCASVTWNEVPGAGRYALYQKSTSGTVTLISAEVTGTSYEVTGLTNGETVGFVLKSRTSKGWSTWSATGWTRPEGGK